MGIQKTQLLSRGSVYWVNMNADIELIIRQCTTCLEYQQMQSLEDALHYEIPRRPWQVVGANVSMINNKTTAISQ